MRTARFDQYELDVESGELRGASSTIRLQIKPLELLLLLLEQPGEVVTGEAIRARLWPVGTVVEFDHGIATALKKLRRALGDDAARPRYIETLPRRGYRWTCAVDWSGTTQAVVGAVDAIAVLPFVNLSVDKENEYFSDGLAEEILNLLTRVPGLCVIARTSAFVFRGSGLDIRTIGRTLGVQTILEGSVRRAGTRIRVTAQLIDAAAGLHLWSERYDRELTDIFAVQDEIAEAIVGKLRRHRGASAKAAARPTANLDAYDAYLKGRYHAATVTPDAAGRARGFFEQAIALDPSYAPAYTGLARSLLISVQFGLKSGRELMPQMKAAALRAVALDDQEAEAQAMLGIVAGAFDYDWTEALRRCRLALACEPALPAACHMCAQFILIPQRRFEEAVAVLERVLVEDPLAPLSRKTLAEALFMGDLDPQRAIDELQRLIEWDDRFWLAHFTLANIFAETGMTREAIGAYEKGLAIAPFPPLIGGLASVYARAGDHARAEDLLRRLDAPEHANNRSKSYMFFHLDRLELDPAAHYLAEMIEARDPDVIWVACHRSIERLKQHARFGELLRKMNLTSVAHTS